MSWNLISPDVYEPCQRGSSQIPLITDKSHTIHAFIATQYTCVPSGIQKGHGATYHTGHLVMHAVYTSTQSEHLYPMHGSHTFSITKFKDFSRTPRYFSKDFFVHVKKVVH